MINMQTLVDNAINSNAEAYKNSYSSALYWEDNDKAKNDWGLALRHEYRAIRDTLTRLFPDYEEHITDALTTLRVEVISEYKKAA